METGESAWPHLLFIFFVSSLIMKDEAMMIRTAAAAGAARRSRAGAQVRRRCSLADRMAQIEAPFLLALCPSAESPSRLVLGKSAQKEGDVHAPSCFIASSSV